MPSPAAWRLGFRLDQESFGCAQDKLRETIFPFCLAALAVNVVLPFFHVLEVVGGEGDPAADSGLPYVQRYRESYRRFGLLQDNELLREMRDRLFSPGWQVPIDSDRRQQGLLHLHHLLRGGG